MAGLALIALVVGAAVILAVGRTVSTEYWAAAAGLSGALVGILVPSPRAGVGSLKTAPAGAGQAGSTAGAAGSTTGSAPMSGRNDAGTLGSAEVTPPVVGVLLLAAVGVVAFVAGVVLALQVTHGAMPDAHDKAITDASDALIALGSAAGGALVGLFAPTPGGGSGQK